MKPPTSPRRRAFTLLETVVVVLVLSLSVPAAIVCVTDLSDRRADATRALRATILAQGVMEQVLADVASTSPGLGPAALADVSTYVDASGSGLRDRLAPVSRPAADAGISFDLGISGLVSAAGTTDADPSANRYRIVTVQAAFTTSRGSSASIEISSMVPGV